MLYFLLKPLYEDRDYSVKGREYLEMITSIEIRKRITESFVYESGLYVRSKDILEIEGKSNIIHIRRKTAKEEYYELKGLPYEEITKSDQIDPESRLRKYKADRPQSVFRTELTMDQDEELPF